MNSTSTPSPENFKKMTLDFYESYQLINGYVAELYQLPRKFVDEAEPAMERYMKECEIPGAPRKNALSYPDVLAFIDQLDDLTLETCYLFSEHKNHFNKSAVYMKKIGIINEPAAQKAAPCPMPGKELLHELDTLNTGLMDIKTKADEMIGKMEKLELKWFRLKKLIND